MYQNCAPVTVTGGSDGDASDFFSKLPDMFVANIPNAHDDAANGCEVVTNQDFVFPNPGDSVETYAGAKPGSSLAGGGCASMTKMGAGLGKMGSPAAPTGGQSAAPSVSASQPAASSAVVSAPATPIPTPSNSAGVFAPGASSAAAGPQTSFTTLVVTETAGQVAPTVAPAAPSQPAGTGVAAPPPAASGSCVPCTNEGGVVCVGSSQFGLCDHGCAVPQALAAGMTCANGAITRRSIRPSRHFRRRHGSEMI